MPQTKDVEFYREQNERLIAFLIEKRKEAGLSQRALAEKLGVVQSYVTRVEKSERRLDVVEFIAYCKALKTSPQKILKQLVNDS